MFPKHHVNKALLLLNIITYLHLYPIKQQHRLWCLVTDEERAFVLEGGIEDAMLLLLRRKCRVNEEKWVSESQSVLLIAFVLSSSVSTGERIGTSYRLSFQYIDRTYFLSFNLSFDMASVAFFSYEIVFFSFAFSLSFGAYWITGKKDEGRMSYEREHMNEFNKKKKPLFQTPFSFVLLCHWFFVGRCAHRGVRACSIAALIERRIGSTVNTNTYLLLLLLLS